MCYAKANHPRWENHHSRRHAKRRWKQKMAMAWGYPPVNVEELDDRYEILIYAAGHDKEEFSISLKDDTLIVKAGRPSKAEEAPELNWRRQEFRPTGFKRFFELNEKIDREAISAQYVDGVLKITLAKKPGSETVRQEIEVL